jgi:hypothetical protein
VSKSRSSAIGHIERLPELRTGFLDIVDTNVNFNTPGQHGVLEADII